VAEESFTEGLEERGRRARVVFAARNVGEETDPHAALGHALM